MQLTVIILTLNEADRMERCLTSVPKNARVVLIDSFSSDRTPQVAQETWSRLQRPASHLAVIQKQWPGFVKAREESLKWVQTPWVLWLDADEWISPELAQELQQLETLSSTRAVYEMPRQSRYMGRWIRHGGWYPDYKRRLARRQYCHWVSGPLGSAVHEDLKPLPDSSGVGRLKGHLYHEPFRDAADHQATNDRYSSLLAEGLAHKWRTENKQPPSRAYIFVKVVIKFVENYLWKLGFLDGHAGWRIALGSCRSLALRYHKATTLLTDPSGAPSSCAF